MTNGVISVTVGGAVALKVVAGCDGQRAKYVAAKIRDGWPMDRDGAYAIAKAAGLGCPDCLVVLDAEGERFGGGEDLGPLYRATFADPRFNPRWRGGAAPHVHIIEGGTV